MMPFIELFLVLSGFTIIYFITRYFRLRVTLSGQKIIPNSEKSSNSKIVLKSEDIVPAAKQVSVIKKDKGEIVVFSQKSNTITIQEMPGVKEYKKEIVTQVTQSPQNIEKSVEKNVLCLAEENLSLNQTQIDNSWNSIDRNEIQNQSQSAELTQKTTFLSAGKIESDSTKFGIKITPIISPNIGEENTTDLKFGYDERLKESIGLTLSTLVILAIEPKITVLSPNQEQLFTITGIDQFGQKIEPGKLIWRATGGVIDSTGKLIVSPDAKGAFSITVVSIESGIKRHNPAKNLLLIKVSLQLFSLLLARKRLIKEVLNYVVDELGISKARDILDEHLNDDFYSFSELLIFDEVTERLTEWIVGMVVDKLIDYLGKFTSVCFDSSSNKIVCYSNYIVLPELSEIEILPITTTAKLGNGLQLELRGKDQAGEEIKIDKKILWSTTAGEITSRGLLLVNTPHQIAYITAKIDRLNDRLTVKFEELGGEPFTQIANSHNKTEVLHSQTTFNKNTSKSDTFLFTSPSPEKCTDKNHLVNTIFYKALLPEIEDKNSIYDQEISSKIYYVSSYSTDFVGSKLHRSMYEEAQEDEDEDEEYMRSLYRKEFYRYIKYR